MAPQDKHPSMPPNAGVPQTALNRRELIEQIADDTGMKRQDIGAVIDRAMYAVRDAFLEDRRVNVPGMGRGQVRRVEDMHQGKAVTVRFIIDEGPLETGAQQG